MPMLARRWTLKRLEHRLRRAERAKNAAMQALVVRDRCIAPRARYDYQDPGQVATMLDEIAVLRSRIATMQTPKADRAGPPPVSPPHPPAMPARGAFEPLFEALREQLGRIQREAPDRRIGGEALRRALAAAFASQPVLDAAFASLRAEMARIQRSVPPDRIGLASLRDAVRASLVGGEPEGTEGPAAPGPRADACPEPAIPDRPAA